MDPRVDLTRAVSYSKIQVNIGDKLLLTFLSPKKNPVIVLHVLFSFLTACHVEQKSCQIFWMLRAMSLSNIKLYTEAGMNSLKLMFIIPTWIDKDGIIYDLSGRSNENNSLGPIFFLS
jgi:hypothetical protein